MEHGEKINKDTGEITGGWRNMGELVTIEETTTLQAFSDSGGLDPIISEVKELVVNFDHDVLTGSGRKKTASLAMKVRKLKTRLDGMGKDLTTEWARKKKAVDQNRKAMREELDELAMIARKPLDDWEARMARIAEEEKLEAERIALKKQVELDHEMGLLIDADMDRKKEEAERQAEKERLEAEERLRLEGERKAKEEAEAEIKRLEAEKEAALLREKEVARKLKEAKAKKKFEEKQAALQKKIDEENAKQAIIDAEERAKKQQIAKQKAEEERKQAEENARIADANHRKAYNKIIIEKLMAISPSLSRAIAIDILKAIASNKIDNVTINY